MMRSRGAAAATTTTTSTPTAGGLAATTSSSSATILTPSSSLQQQQHHQQTAHTNVTNAGAHPLAAAAASTQQKSPDKLTLLSQTLHLETEHNNTNRNVINHHSMLSTNSESAAFSTRLPLEQQQQHEMSVIQQRLLSRVHSPSASSNNMPSFHHHHSYSMQAGDTNTNSSCSGAVEMHNLHPNAQTATTSASSMHNKQTTSSLPINAMSSDSINENIALLNTKGPPAADSSLTGNFNLKNLKTATLDGLMRLRDHSNTAAAHRARLVQRYHRRGGGSTNKKRGSSGVGRFSVQVPVKLLLYTAGVFLALPLTLFVWKQILINKTSEEQMGHGSMTSKQDEFIHRRQRPYPNWVDENTNNVLDATLNSNETSVDGDSSYKNTRTSEKINKQNKESVINDLTQQFLDLHDDTNIKNQESSANNAVVLGKQQQDDTDTEESENDARKGSEPIRKSPSEATTTSNVKSKIVEVPSTDNSESREEKEDLASIDEQKPHQQQFVDANEANGTVHSNTTIDNSNTTDGFLTHVEQEIITGKLNEEQEMNYDKAITSEASNKNVNSTPLVHPSTKNNNTGPELIDQHEQQK